MAEKSYIVNKNRTNLGDVLPLDTPYSVFIDVCNACNFKCKFCAIQTSDRKLNFEKHTMDFDLFKKTVDDLKTFNKPLKMLILAANGEPLLNNKFAEMVKYAKDSGVSEHIETVTNASLLNPELNRKIVEAGLNRIRISIEAPDAEGYYQMSGVKIDWDTFKANIQDFYNNRQQCEVYIKTVDAAVDTQEKVDRFYREFEGMCDKISVEHVIPIWTDSDKIYDDFEIGQSEGLHGDKIREVKCCPFPFYSFVVNTDGEVTVCCNDWQRGIVVGNIKNENIVDIWNGEKYKEFLIGMLKDGRRKNHSTCNSCVYPCYDAVDIIDDVKDSILEKYINKK